MTFAILLDHFKEVSSSTPVSWSAKHWHVHSKTDKRSSFIRYIYIVFSQNIEVTDGTLVKLSASLHLSTTSTTNQAWKNWFKCNCIFHQQDFRQTDVKGRLHANLLWNREKGFLVKKQTASHWKKTNYVVFIIIFTYENTKKSLVKIERNKNTL